MDIPKYNRDKYYRIMDLTQSNYANQLKRICRDAKRADFILIYYSISLIIYTLSTALYPNLFDSNWSSFCSIILSVIVLIYSIINSKAGYPKRIECIEDALNKVKSLKREVGGLPRFEEGEKTIKCPRMGKWASQNGQAETDSGNCPKGKERPLCRKDACEKLEKLKAQYDEVVSGVEIRDDLDFYYTVQSLCKRYEIDINTGKSTGDLFQKSLSEDEYKEIKGYIAELNPRLQVAHIWVNRIWHVCLYAAPVLIYLGGITAKFLIPAIKA